MRPFVLGFGLAAGLGAAAAFGPSDTVAENPAGQPAQARKGDASDDFGGGIGGHDHHGEPSIYWHHGGTGIYRNPPTQELSREEVFLPETPEYVVERSDRLNEAWRSMNAALNRPVTLDVERIPLRSAVEQLADQIGVTLRFDDQAITEEEIPTDETVTFHAEGLSAEAAFERLLEPYGLVVAIDGESLVITTGTIADEIMTVRVYPVPDLVVSRYNGKLGANFLDLMDSIQTVTKPWEEIDGLGGVMRPYTDGGVHALVVRQTTANHREIEKLLYDLRQARPAAVREALSNPEQASVPAARGGTPDARSPEADSRAELIERLREAVRETARDEDRQRLLREALEGLRGTDSVEPAPDQTEDGQTTVVVPIPRGLIEAPRPGTSDEADAPE